MATKVGTISISAVKLPHCSNWSFPPSTIKQDTTYYVKATIKNNSNVSIKYTLDGELKDTKGGIVYISSGYKDISSGSSKELSANIKLIDDSALCSTSWTLQNVCIKAKYGNKTYGPFCKQSSRNITLTPNYKGSLGTGHTIPSSAYLGDTINFTIKGKNTNKCFNYNLWAKVICKLSTDESKKFEGTGSKVKTNAGAESDLPVSVKVPTNVPEGTYNVYAELHAGA